MIRLFVGLELPSHLADQLYELRGRLPGARWIEPANMHLTLRFIGDVDEGAAADIDTALAAIAAPAFELSVTGLGQFNRGKLAHALWAGVAATEPLARLQGKAESALVREAGLKPEGRKFKPHITLARLKNTPAGVVENYIAQMGPVRSEPFAVTAFTLFSSQLTKAGAAYTAERRYRLTGAAGLNTPPGVAMGADDPPLQGPPER